MGTIVPGFQLHDGFELLPLRRPFCELLHCASTTIQINDRLDWILLKLTLDKRAVIDTPEITPLPRGQRYLTSVSLNLLVHALLSWQLDKVVDQGLQIIRISQGLNLGYFLFEVGIEKPFHFLKPCGHVFLATLQHQPVFPVNVFEQKFGLTLPKPEVVRDYSAGLRVVLSEPGNPLSRLQLCVPALKELVDVVRNQVVLELGHQSCRLIVNQVIDSFEFCERFELGAMEGLEHLGGDQTQTQAFGLSVLRCALLCRLVPLLRVQWLLAERTLFRA